MIDATDSVFHLSVGHMLMYAKTWKVDDESDFAPDCEYLQTKSIIIICTSNYTGDRML